MNSRAIIIGRDAADAVQHRADAAEESVTFVSSNHLSLTIRGSVAGIQARTVYVTPRASLGSNYDVALEAAEACLAKTGGALVYLDSRG